MCALTVRESVGPALQGEISWPQVCAKAKKQGYMLSCHNLGMGQGGQAGRSWVQQTPTGEAQPRTIGLGTHAGPQLEGLLRKAGALGLLQARHLLLTRSRHNSDVLVPPLQGPLSVPRPDALLSYTSDCPSWPATGLRLFPAWVLLLLPSLTGQRSREQRHRTWRTFRPEALLTCPMRLLLGPGTPQRTVSAS